MATKFKGGGGGSTALVAGPLKNRFFVAFLTMIDISKIMFYFMISKGSILVKLIIKIYHSITHIQLYVQEV